MEASDKTAVDGTTPTSGPDGFKILNTKKISKLSTELGLHVKGIMRVSTNLIDAAVPFDEESKEAVAKTEQDVKELMKKLRPILEELPGLADDSRKHFGAAEESDEAPKRKPSRGKRKPSTGPQRANKKTTATKESAVKRSTSRSSSSLLSSSSDSGDSNEMTEQSSEEQSSDDENAGPHEDAEDTDDTEDTKSTPHNHQDGSDGATSVSPIS